VQVNALVITSITGAKNMEQSDTKTMSAVLAGLAEQRLYVLDQDLESRVQDAPDYFRKALHNFCDNVSDRSYPCHFGRRALKQRELFVTYADQARLPELGSALSAFLDHVRPTPDRRQVLACFVEPGAEQSHDDYAATFWFILQWLHCHDPRPWPAEVPRDPHDPDWEFSFAGTAMFVFAAAPTHRVRRSRNLSDCLILLFQPRNVFIGIEGGTRAGKEARRRIRASLAEWDHASAHPSMGDYGDPSNFEWRQYVIPDDQSEIYDTCPFKT
jgi:FPC/CPF motif-containing protein YcgG